MVVGQIHNIHQKFNGGQRMLEATSMSN